MHSMRERCVCGGRLAPPLLFFSPSYLGQPLHPVHQAGQRRGVGRLGPQPQLRHVPDVGHKLGPDGGGQGAGGPEQGAQGGRGGRVHSPGGRVARVSERRHSFSLFFPAGAPPLAHRPGARVRPHHHPHLAAMEAADDPLQFADLALDDEGGGGTGGDAAGALPDAPVFAAPPPPAPVAEDEPPPPYESVMAGSSTSAAGLAPVSVPEVRERERGGRRKKQTRRHEKKSCIASQRPRPPLPHSRTHPTTRHDRPWPRRLPHHGLCR
jgi:hypothetical protein